MERPIVYSRITSVCSQVSATEVFGAERMEDWATATTGIETRLSRVCVEQRRGLTEVNHHDYGAPSELEPDRTCDFGDSEPISIPSKMASLSVNIRGLEPFTPEKICAQTTRGPWGYFINESTHPTHATRGVRIPTNMITAKNGLASFEAARVARAGMAYRAVPMCKSIMQTKIKRLSASASMRRRVARSGCT